MRHALRTLGRSPSFAAAAILTLGLGIGASTALFSIGYGVLLRPLPYGEADRLAVVRAEQDFDGAPRPVPARFPFAAMAQWPAVGRTYSSAAFFSEEVAAFSDPAGAELLDIAVVSGSFFETLRGELVAGRALTPDDEHRPAAVISERLWHRAFAGDADLARMPLMLTGHAYTVVGVARHTLQVPAPQTDVWLPAAFYRSRQPGCCGFTPLIRVNDAAAIAAVAEEAGAIAAAVAADMPRALGGVRVRVMSLRDAIVGETRSAILVLGVAAALLLALALANLVNLLLARMASRANELAVRVALGAPRRRLLAQGLAESALLTTGGGAVGVALAVLVVTTLKSGAVTTLPRLDAVRIDGTVLLFALLLTTALTMTMAILPAVRWREFSFGALPARGPSPPRIRRLALRALTVGQLAASIVLLVGASLLGRSLAALVSTDIGVRTDGVVTASLNLAMGRSLTDRQQIDLVDRVLARVRTLPGVTAAGVGTARPPDVSRVRVTLRQGDEARASYQAQGVPATPGYFRVLGIRLERGRLLTDSDGPLAPPVALMSIETARRLFGDLDPLGRTIRLPILRDGQSGAEDVTVVGLTAIVKYGGLDRAADDVVYRPFAQQAWRAVFLVAHTSGDAGALAGQLRRELGAVDRDLVVADVTTLDAVLADATAQPRARTLLLFALSVAAVSIALVGLYGVVSYSIAQRTGEFGVRLAIGAAPARIRRMVLGEGLVVVATGCAVGVVAAFAFARMSASLLFAIEPADPASFATAVAVVAASGLLASDLPAARASRTDPVRALKTE